MKKITLFIAMLFLTFSCKKELGVMTEETMSYEEYPMEASDQIHDETVNDIKEDLSETAVEDINYVNSFELIETINDDFLFPKLELKNNLCDNLSLLKLKDLTSGSHYEVNIITKENKADLESFGFKGTFSDNVTIIIKDYVRSKTVKCNGENIKVGVGLRCFIHVTSKKYKAGANLPYLAANVQLDNAKASYKIVSLGFGLGGDVFKHIKSTGSYDVEGFSQVEMAFSNILGTLSDENEMVIDPVVLP